MPTAARINPDIEKERRNASFDSNEFSTWYYGGADKLVLKRQLDKDLYDDLDEGMDHEYLSYEDMCHVSIKHAIACVNKLKRLQQKYNAGGSDIYP